MPATNTITSFYTFIAGTRARAIQVNTNFDNFRGNILPINTDTATASHQVHNLGSVDHQFLNIYLKNPPVVDGQSPKLEIQVVENMDLTPTRPYQIAGQAGDGGTQYPHTFPRVSFSPGISNGVDFNFVVPSEYTPGSRMSLTLRGYCNTSPSSFQMEVGSALYKASITAMNATLPANVFTSTSNIQPTLSGIYFFDTSLRLTTSDGKINSLTVTAGDIIACYLMRKGSATADTNTSAFHMTNLVVELNS